MIDEPTARHYIESRRWPNGPRCPICGLGERVGNHSPGLYRCMQCKEAFSARTGTIFERSHVPLHLWLTALALIADNPDIPSATLADALGITQKSAWFMLHRLREACGSKLETLRAPKVLDAVVDAVLAFRPKPKSKPGKKRARRAKKAQASKSSM